MWLHVRMLLRDFAHQSGVKVLELAAQVGITRQHMYRLINGKRRVPAELVLPIERATGGAVTRHDLRPDLYPTPDRAAE